jgi:protein SCO1/2
MKRGSIALLLVCVAVLCFGARCSREESKPLSEAGEKLFTVRGTILSRNASANTVFLDHDEIPGFMTAMKMDYAVRGADVSTLPADNKRIEAKLHVTDRAYWITDVKATP